MYGLTMPQQVAIVIQDDGINQWFNTIMQQNVAGSTGSSQPRMPGPKIQLVPPKLRQIESNRKYYEPLVVSIGPYHHGKAELRKLERLKFPMAREIVLRSGEPIEVLYSKVAEVASDARRCYEEGSTDKFNDSDFTQMMFLDGCFILHFILCLLRSPQDLKMKANVMEDVKRDLFLLENQLPFLVLQLLMNFRFKNGEEGGGKKLINEFMDLIRGPAEDVTRQQPQPGNGYLQPIHLLQYFHTRFVCKPDPSTKSHMTKCLQRLGRVCIPFSRKSKPDPRGKNLYWYSYRSAKELKTVGIHFRPSNSYLFTDVTFTPTILEGVLNLPPIVIDDSTKRMLLNLVAYETCPDAPDDLVVTSYICFLDSLIDTPEDVKELRSKGIILNVLGSDQHAADLFNEISTELVPNLKAFEQVKHQIQLHYDNILKRWIAESLHTHFSSPWTFLAFTAAIFGLCLSAVQTYTALVDEEKLGGCPCWNSTT